MKRSIRKTYKWSLPAVLLTGIMASPTISFAEDVEIGPVTVTATRSVVSLVDAPGAITIISSEDIKNMPSGDLLDMVRETAGISLLGQGVGGRKAISIRGLDSKHTLILINGKRIAASSAVLGHSNFENKWLDADNIQQIEIVRGPLSALYGSEAMGGVINIITKPVSLDEWSFGAVLGGGFTEDSGSDHQNFSAYASGPMIPLMKMIPGFPNLKGARFSPLAVSWHSLQTTTIK